MAPLSNWLRTLPHERPLLTLVGAVLVVEIVGASGSIFTAQGLTAWYPTLHQPALAPPNWVFGPVWTTIFALLGGALWLLWRQLDRSPQAVRVGVGVFVVQFVVNIAWSAVFFGQQDIGGGLAVIGLLWVLIVVTVWAFDRVDRRAALLCVPYLLWVSFAAYLNYRFWVLN